MSSPYHDGADGIRKNVYAHIPDIVALERDRPCLHGHAWEEWTHDVERIVDDVVETTYERKADKDARIRNAKKLCAGCPVLDECRGWALTLPDPVDQHVAGGLTTAERRGVRKQSEPIRHGTATGWRQHAHRGDEPCQPCVEARRCYLQQIAILRKDCA